MEHTIPNIHRYFIEGFGLQQWQGSSSLFQHDCLLIISTILMGRFHGINKEIIVEFKPIAPIRTDILIYQSPLCAYIDAVGYL